MRLAPTLNANNRPNSSTPQMPERQPSTMVSKAVRISGMMGLGLLTLITVLAVITIVLYWNGVLLFLFGA